VSNKQAYPQAEDNGSQSKSDLFVELCIEESEVRLPTQLEVGSVLFRTSYKERNEDAVHSLKEPCIQTPTTVKVKASSNPNPNPNPTVFNTCRKPA
jgi:hypothetical protein